VQATPRLELTNSVRGSGAQVADFANIESKASGVKPPL